MKSLHKAHILKLRDQHEYERQELAKKQRKELEELLTMIGDIESDE
jgi:hypothetical protein